MANHDRAGHESLTLAFCLATRRRTNLGPYLLRPRPLRAATFHRLGFGWSSLCNRVAQAWGSVRSSTPSEVARNPFGFNEP
jgi:hypothetical protein